MEWNSVYETGINNMDKQHMEMVDAINAVEKAKQNWLLPDKRSLLTMNDALARLHYYSRFHFEVEEALMHACKSPEMDRHMGRHIAQHQAFLALLRGMLLDSLTKDLPESQVGSLSLWLDNHLLTEDLAMYRIISPADRQSGS